MGQRTISSTYSSYLQLLCLKVVAVIVLNMPVQVVRVLNWLRFSWITAALRGAGTP